MKGRSETESDKQSHDKNSPPLVEDSSREAKEYYSIDLFCIFLCSFFARKDFHFFMFPNYVCLWGNEMKASYENMFILGDVLKALYDIIIWGRDKEMQ
jgi:hypothetical protein